MNFVKKKSKIWESKESDESSKSSDQKRQAKYKPKRVRKDLEPWMKEVFMKWLRKHHKHPFPSEKEKLNLSVKLGLSKRQVAVWFINYRRVNIGFTRFQFTPLVISWLCL